MTNPINWYEKGPDKVLDVFYDDIEDDEKRFVFLKLLIDKFPELQIDWLEAFEDIKESLIKAERIADVLFFVNWYSRKFAKDYNRRYEFVERDLCDYFLFKKDYTSLQKRIDFIQQHPVPGIDTVTIPLLFQLIYHGRYQQAIRFAEQVWQPIAVSNELMGHAEFEFVNTIYVNELQKFYESVLANTSFDTDSMFHKIVAMGFDNDKDLFNKVILAINADVDTGLIEESVAAKQGHHMLHLNIQFLKYMYHEFNLPFIFSEFMWQFVATLKIFGKHGKENWFFIDAQTMDKHIVDRYDGFLGSNQLEIFGKVWGLDYLTSFFYHHQLITPDQYQIMMENNDHFKNEMMHIAGADLWKMMYVFSWPDIGKNRDDKLEQALFTSSFGKDMMEAENEITAYISTLPFSDRIRRELKLDKKEAPQFLNTGNSPIIKMEPDIGRNDPCPCGSGKKYKKCCLDK